jgi:type II secretory pathway pseudopilin PulG
MNAPCGHSDAGFTLVETALTVLVMAIVLAAAFPTVSLFFGEETAVQNTYSAVDQLVLASEVATRYIHEAVDSSPASPATPFVSASANAVTFYANTGNVNGPEKIVVTVTSGASGRAFVADIYSPATGSCPFSLTSTATCTYGASTRSILLINYLTNGTGGSPVFTYTLQGGGTCGGPPPGSGGTTLKSGLTSGTTYTALSVNALTNAMATGDTVTIGSGSTTQDVIVASPGAAVNATSVPVTSFKANAAYASGASVYDNVCNATQLTSISAVALSLQATKFPGGQPTGYQTLAYLFSPSYSPTVG